MSCTIPRSKSSHRAARNREAAVKSAPHFPEVDPKGIVRLRDYQVGKYDEVLAHLAAGAQVVPLVLPTGAGKTTICKAIAAGWFTGGPDRLVIILGPTRAVVRQFQEPGPRIDNGHETVPWRADEDPQVGLPQPTPAQLVDLAWLSAARGIFISTRQAWGRGLMLKKLADAPFKADGLRNLLVIADEAHHHHRKSAAGKLVAELERRGATVIPVTATPYYELGPLFPPEVEARAVRISSVEFAQMTDEHGRPYCPREWDFTRHFVGESSDVADAYDTGAKPKRGKAQRALEACRAMAAQWAKDGIDAAENGAPQRPKAIFFLPERAWVAPMQRALAEVGAARDRVVDFTGDDLSDDALELLDRERKVKSYQDSEVDAILSCNRFDEGTDWPLCAVGYCWRIPDSVVRVLQRLGRTSRGKSKIEGYPERWKDAQTMRFFVRKLSGDGAAEAWRKHGELALVLGLFLADYREALRWARVVGTERGDREDTAGDKAPRPRPPRETDPLVLAKAKRQAMQLAQRPGAKGGYVIDGLRRDFPSIPLRQAKEIAALVVKARGVSEEEIARRRAKVQADLEAQATREGRGAGWVREQYEERFAALMDEILELPVEADGALLREIGLRFGAEEVNGFVERFRAAGDGAGFAWPETREGLIAFAHEHGERYRTKHGRWPTGNSRQIDSIDTTWGALEACLRRCFDLDLAAIYSKKKRVFRTWDEAADELLAFNQREGRMPYKGERRMMNTWIALRHNAPEKLVARALPLRADPQDVKARQVATVRNRTFERRSQLAASRKNALDLTINDLATLAAKHPNATRRSSLDGVSLAALDAALQRGKVKGEVCQVTSWGRLQMEIRAECWDGATRVAFLDWEQPDETARDWAIRGQRSMATRRTWPDLRAEPAAKPKRKARK